MQQINCRASNQDTEHLRGEISQMKAELAAEREALEEERAELSRKRNALSELQQARSDLQERIAQSAWADYDEMEKPAGSPPRAEMRALRNAWRVEATRLANAISDEPEKVRQAIHSLDLRKMALESREASVRKRIARIEDFMEDEKARLTRIRAAEKALEQARHQQSEAASNAARKAKLKEEALTAISASERAAIDLERARRDVFLTDCPDEREVIEKRVQQAEREYRKRTEKAASARAAIDEIETRRKATQAEHDEACHRVADRETALKAAHAALARTRARKHAFEIVKALAETPESDEVRDLLTRVDLVLLDSNGSPVRPA